LEGDIGRQRVIDSGRFGRILVVFGGFGMGLEDFG